MSSILQVLMPLILALITKLGPTIEDDLVKYILGLLPDEHKHFVGVCVLIVNGVNNSVNVKVEDKKRVSVDTCLFYARSMGMVLDQPTLDLLGLKMSDGSV